jgi:hypothetical protein
VRRRAVIYLALTALWLSLAMSVVACGSEKVPHGSTNGSPQQSTPEGGSKSGAGANAGGPSGTGYGTTGTGESTSNTRREAPLNKRCDPSVPSCGR